MAGMNDTALGKPEQEFQASDGVTRPYHNLSGMDSPLARRLQKSDENGSVAGRWLLQHVCDRWSTLHENMNSWREKMAKWERQAEDDFRDRQTSPDQVNPSSTRDIFTDQNDTLGMSGGFADFHFAQAKDDIFGTRPWLAATPEGKSDTDLADIMSKHLQWKFNQSSLEEVLTDALHVAGWGGTAFVQSGFKKEVETYTTRVPVAHDPEGEPIRGEDGDYVRDARTLAAMGVEGGQFEWKEIDIDDTTSVCNNVCNALIDWKDIAFETTAAKLDLGHTDVFVRCRRGLLDAMDQYGIPRQRAGDLVALINGYTETSRDHRDESDPAVQDANEENANPLVTLVEGYVRCAPFGGAPSRIHVVFSPDLNILFAVDYIQNVTPGGILPIHPVRIHKIAGRVFGRGYFEKYENYNNAVDRQYNSITYRNRTNSHVHVGVHPEALQDYEEGGDFVLDPTMPHVLREDKSIDDLIEFKAAPDINDRSDSLLQQMLQMGQMRSGITSAAQGEMKGVPSANTATGTRDIQSRGATLLKAQIDKQMADIREIVEFNALLVYANQDQDETFAWGEGREQELFTIKTNDVLGMRANITLTMTQSQNQRKLESALTAIDIVTKYSGLQEIDKEASRGAFVQALSSIGFQNADDIIRPAMVDPMAILAVLPPDIQPAVQAALAQAGLIALPDTAPQGTEAESAAPVMESA